MDIFFKLKNKNYTESPQETIANSIFKPMYGMESFIKMILINIYI